MRAYGNPFVATVAYAMVMNLTNSHERRDRSTLRVLQWISTTRANSRVGLVADIAVGFGLLFAGIGRRDLHPTVGVLTIVLGLVVFSLIEYCFHRWLFHGPLRVLKESHWKHHQTPLAFDALPFFLPPLGILVVAAVLALLLPTSFALLLTGGLAAGYAAYGLSHAIIHSVHFRRSLPRRWAAAHHIHHHHPNANFGVTTPLWDILLGTRYTSKSVRGSNPDRTGARASEKG